MHRLGNKLVLKSVENKVKSYTPDEKGEHNGPDFPPLCDTFLIDSPAAL
jgi:hypothetical protein